MSRKVLWGKVLILAFMLVLLTSCTSLKLDQPSGDKQTVLILPVLVSNQAERVGQHGFYYIYEIVNEDDLKITYEAVIKTPAKGDMLIIDTLPPGNYRVDKFMFKTVGGGDFTYGQNVFPRNDKFKLEWGRITIFSKSLNVRIFNKTPGRGSETSYSFDLDPVTREQEDDILITLKTLPNFEAWRLADRNSSICTICEGDSEGLWKEATPNDTSTQVDISGTYRSDISGSGDWSLGRDPDIEVILKQNKGEISGTFSGTRSGEIEGILNGDTIKFKWFLTVGRTESGRGEWKLPNDGTTWNGTWRSTRGSQGTWNLTKIK